MIKSSLKTWQIKVFVLCWIAYTAVYFGRVNLSVTIPDIQKYFGFTKDQVGIIGSLFFWIYGIGQIINGYIGDKICIRVFIFIGILVSGVINILFGLSTSLIIMTVLWALNGYFQSILWGPIIKTLSIWFSQKDHSQTAVAISTSMVGGYLLAWGLLGQIILHSSWRWAFWIPGGCLISYSLIWYLKIKTHPKEVNLQSPSENMLLDHINIKNHSSLTFMKIFKKTKLYFIVIACLTQGIIKDSIALWGPTFLMETSNLSMGSTTKLIIAIPFMNFAGMILAGYLNKRLKLDETLATTVLFLFTIVFLILLIKLRHLSPLFSLIFLGLSSAMMFGAHTLLVGAIPMRFDKYNKVSSIAGFLDFSTYAAAGLATYITGLIVERLGWDTILIIWVVVTIIGTASLILNWVYTRK